MSEETKATTTTTAGGESGEGESSYEEVEEEVEVEEMVEVEVTDDDEEEEEEEGQVQKQEKNAKRKREDSDDEDDQDEKQPKKRPALIDDEAEDDEDDNGEDDEEEKNEYEKDGFVVDDSDSDSDESDDDRPKRKRKKFSRMRKARKEIELDDDDLALIAESKGTQGGLSSNKEEGNEKEDEEEKKRMKIAPAAAGADELRRQLLGDDDSDEDEDEESTKKNELFDFGTGSDDSDDSDDGFIEKTKEDKEEARRIRKMKKQLEKTNQQNDFIDNFTLEQQKKVHSIFGKDGMKFIGLDLPDKKKSDSDDDDDDDGEDDEGEETKVVQNRVQIPLRTEDFIKSTLEPSVVKKKFLSGKDEDIRKKDMPERKQLWRLSHIGEDVAEDEYALDDNDRKLEALFVASRLPDPSYVNDLKSKARKELVQAKLMAARKILNLMYEENLEPVYIATFRSDVFETVRFTKEEQYEFDVSDIVDEAEQAEELKKKENKAMKTLMIAANTASKNAKQELVDAQRRREQLLRTQYHPEDLQLVESKVRNCKDRFDEMEMERKAKLEINSIALGRRVKLFDENVVYMIQDLHRKFLRTSHHRKNLKQFVENKLKIMRQDEEEEEEEEEKQDIASGRMYICKMMEKYMEDMVKFDISSSSGGISSEKLNLCLLLDEYYLNALQSYAVMVCGGYDDFFRNFKRVEKKNEFKPYIKDGTLRLMHFLEVTPRDLASSTVAIYRTLSNELRTATHKDESEALQVLNRMESSGTLSLSSTRSSLSPKNAASKLNLAQYMDVKSSLNALQDAVMINISNEPLFLRTMSDLAASMLKITTKVTKRGKTELADNLFHSLYGVHLLREEPFGISLDVTKRLVIAQNESGFAERMLLYARLLKAERKGLIEIEYVLPEQLLRRVADVAFQVPKVYVEDGESWLETWSAFRSKCLSSCFKSKILPRIEIMIQEILRRLSDEFVLDLCAERMRYRLLEGPLLKNPVSLNSSSTEQQKKNDDFYDHNKDEDDEDETEYDKYDRRARVLALAIDFPTSTAVVMDKRGELLDSAEVDSSFNMKYAEKFVSAIENMLREHDVDFIVLNTPESRCMDAKQCLEQCINKVSPGKTSDQKRVFFVDDEVPRMFSVSTRSKKEFPNSDLNTRLAIGLARFVQNPLSEYASLCSTENCDELENLEIEPELQDNVLWMNRKDVLIREFVRVVNMVGVNINECVNFPKRAHTLQFVAGLGPRKADRILREMRRLRGGVRDRTHVYRLLGGRSSKVVAKNALGFIKLGSEYELRKRLLDGSFADSRYERNPLDYTRIHPNEYVVSVSMLKRENVSLSLSVSLLFNTHTYTHTHVRLTYTHTHTHTQQIRYRTILCRFERRRG